MAARESRHLRVFPFRFASFLAEVGEPQEQHEKKGSRLQDGSPSLHLDVCEDARRPYKGLWNAGDEGGSGGARYRRIALLVHRAPGCEAGKVEVGGGKSDGHHERELDPSA